MGSQPHREDVSHIGARSRRVRRWARFAAGLWLFACGLFCWADPVLPTLISDHMVLQQGREIHIWGKADAGEKITVSLAGHTATTTAGCWSPLERSSSGTAGRWAVHAHGSGE